MKRMYIIKSLIFVMTLSINLGTSLAEKPKTVDRPKIKELSSTLKRLNRSMHIALKGSIKQNRKDLGPLIIFEDGKMKLLRANQEVASFPIVPPLAYHQLKVIGHISFAIVIQLQRPDLSQEQQTAWIRVIKKDIVLAKAELQEMSFSAKVIDSQTKLLDHTLKLLAQAEQAPLTKQGLERYSETVVPLMRPAMYKSAQLHLEVIHTQVKRLYALLKVEERPLVRIHLYGGRGARRDNIVIQYFSWLFGEPGGLESPRIVFSENIADHDKALDMFAKYKTEQQLAELIFKDPTQLDRDLLGDTVREQLSHFPNSEKEFEGMSIVKESP